MVKYFCDRCGKEVKCTSRIKRELKNFKVEVITAVNNTWNGGILCRECILKIINKGKDIN